MYSAQLLGEKKQRMEKIMPYFLNYIFKTIKYLKCIFLYEKLVEELVMQKYVLFKFPKEIFRSFKTFT